MKIDDARARAAATYNAAADCYDDPANSFWDRFSRRTIERLRLPQGARVLDVCCGSGAAAIPAADAVGPHGSVLAIDLAAEAGAHPIPSPEAWWSAVLGSGYRGTIEQLDAGERERVRIANMDFIRRSNTRSVEANVVYAIAMKPA